MPEFRQLEKVLRREVPDRPVLFEFFLNDRLYRRACGDKFDLSTPSAAIRTLIESFRYYGYDYATAGGSEFAFPARIAGDRYANTDAKSISLNGESTISDRASFDAYSWMDADACDYSDLDACELPDGMKLIVKGPGGVLENVIALVGYDNLCMLLYDDEQLVYDIFERVGSGLVRYYENAAPHASVGALISNDDWGFNTQTMLAPDDMRRYVFPWHKRIVEAIHRHGKPAILHSCGNYSMILDDLYALGYDARHSYEDNIEPVEKAYDRFLGKLCVLGGVDVNYLITAPEEEIERRSRRLVERSLTDGGYALGSGNSIPDYVPDEKYFAMLRAAREA